MMRVKICGITSLADALAACAAGADALGFVFAKSPRRVEPERAREIIAALPPFVSTVGVFVDENPEEMLAVKRGCGLDLLQLHGAESQSTAAQLGPGVIKALALGKGPAPVPTVYPKAMLLLDTAAPGLAGGSGKTFDWNLAVGLAAKRPVILAGGLTPGNVARAVAQVKPQAVDVSSGVETRPGRKDPEKMKAFVQNAKGGGHAA